MQKNKKSGSSEKLVSGKKVVLNNNGLHGNAGSQMADRISRQNKTINEAFSRHRYSRRTATRWMKPLARHPAIATCETFLPGYGSRFQVSEFHGAAKRFMDPLLVATRFKATFFERKSLAIKRKSFPDTNFSEEPAFPLITNSVNVGSLPATGKNTPKLNVPWENSEIDCVMS